MVIRKLHAVRMFPSISDRSQWEKLNKDKRFDQVRNDAVSMAETAVSEKLIVLPASRFMDFVRNGVRADYEKLYFSRRLGLEALVLAEAFEYQGRYIDRIIDYLWAILDEPTWCAPAHTKTSPDPLPDFDEEFIDLFSAETSMYLAQTLMLMENELSKISPNLVRRIRRTLIERAIQPLETNISRFHWIAGRTNWTPWICSNLLNTAMAVLENDKERLTRIANLLFPCVELYISKFKDDGACEEGASYWALSPARMSLFLEALYQASDGEFSLFDNPKIRLMGEFVADAWIYGRCFAPFSDCPVEVVHFPCGIVHRYAERIKSEKLLDFCDQYRQEVPAALSIRNTFTDTLKGQTSEFRSSRQSNHSGFICTLAELFWAPCGDISVPRCDFVSCYPQNGLVYAKKGSFYVAVKGGHNGVSHAHPDVGQFIIYVDNEPMIIDVGSCEYTRSTFSPQRFENWILNSSGHNVMAFNGVGQPYGPEYAAKAFEFTETAGGFHLTMELAGCYPIELGLRSYRREIHFDMQSGFMLHDSWEAAEKLTAELPLYSPCTLTDGVFGGKLCIESNRNAITHKFPVDDKNLRMGWGDTLWKTVLTCPLDTKGELTLQFKEKAH